MDYKNKKDSKLKILDNKDLFPIYREIKKKKENKVKFKSILKEKIKKKSEFLNWMKKRSSIEEINKINEIIK